MGRKETTCVDISNTPELLRIAEQVCDTNQPAILLRDIKKRVPMLTGPRWAFQDSSALLA